MKANHLYQLEKNFDLKNENFLVKKGTLVTVSEKYNEKDNNIPTVFSLKFGNIIGEYLFDETILEKHLENNTIKILTSRFTVGDSVRFQSEFGNLCGNVQEIKPDALGRYRYVVLFEGKRITALENQLSPC